MRIKPVRSILIVVLLSLLHITSLSHAQTQPRTDAVIRFYENSDTDTKLYLAAVAPGSKTPRKLTDVQIDGTSEISPDGTILLTGGGSADQDSLSYGPLGGTPKQVTVEAGHRVLWTAFSPDSRLLTYTTAALGDGFWVLGLVDIASGNRIEFTGDYMDQLNKGAGFSGAGDIVGWSPDRKTVYLRTYFPFSASGGFDTLIALDISGISFDKPGRYPMATGTRLLPEGEQILNFAFSEDGMKFAVMLADPTNPPANFPGIDAPANTISVRELPTGKEIAAFKSPEGQVLEFPLRWTLDSKKLLFAGGSLGGSYFVTKPVLHILDVDSKAITDIPLLDDPAMALENITVCTDSVFFTANVEDAQGIRTTTLYSASLADPTKETALLSSEFIPLLTCIPAP